MNTKEDDKISADLAEQINILETQIKYPWIASIKTVRDIPNFPFSSFDSLQRALIEGTCALDVSYPAARALSKFIRTPIGILANLMLLTAPFLMVITLVVAAIFLGNYTLLLGIPISVVASVFGNPLNPLRSFMSILNWMAQIGLVFAYLQGFVTITWLLSSFIIPFVANRKFYEDNVKALRQAAQESEPLFVDLYEKLSVRVINNKTNEIYRATIFPS
jgi:hypothetical protein